MKILNLWWFEMSLQWKFCTFVPLGCALKYYFVFLISLRCAFNEIEFSWFLFEVIWYFWLLVWGWWDGNLNFLRFEWKYVKINYLSPNSTFWGLLSCDCQFHWWKTIKLVPYPSGILVEGSQTDTTLPLTKMPLGILFSTIFNMKNSSNLYSLNRGSMAVALCTTSWLHRCVWPS